MTYRAHVHNGFVTIPVDHLPDGTEVTLQLLPSTPAPDHRAEFTDRLLGLQHHSSAESIRAQQHLDRHL